MKSGYEALRAVFDAITLDNLTTRREIADKVGLSVVSVSKAVSELIDAGLIISDGCVSTGGRRSGSLSPAYLAKYLIVDLCSKPFSYTFAYLGESISAKGTATSVRYLPYLRDLDFAENVSLLVNKIAPQCGAVTYAAVALPEPSEYPEDFLGDDIISIFTRRGIAVKTAVSKTDAVVASPSVLSSPSPLLYVSISDRVSAIYVGRSVIVLNWDSVNIDGLKFSDILKCAQSPEGLAAKTEKLLRSASEILGAKTVLLDTYELPAETVDILLGRMDNVEDVTFASPVHEGLSRLLAEKLISEIPSAHMAKQKAQTSEEI